MNDNSHEQFGAAEPCRNGGVREDQPASELVGSGACGRLRVDRAGAEGASVPPAEQRTTRDRETLSGQSDRTEPGAVDATDPALDEDAADRAEAGAAPELPSALHRCGYRLARRDRRGARRSLGAGRASFVPPGLDGVWRRAVPALGGHLGLAYLQPARVGGLPQDSRTGRAHQGEQSIHRGAPPARAERAAGVSTRRHGSSGAARPGSGNVPPQCGRHRDAVAGSGRNGNHQRAASDSRIGGDAASVALDHRSPSGFWDSTATTDRSFSTTRWSGC
jgi:hypothetical protein